jgi:protein-tyrosine phosphatase
VYVHCWGGIGRTSTVVGCLLVDGGLDADAALADIDRRRSVTRKADRAAPQTDAQIDVVRTRVASPPGCPGTEESSRR